MAAAFWAVPQPRPLPRHNIVEFAGGKHNLEGTGSKVLARQLSAIKTAAAHIARVRGKEQGTRYLARMGETHRPYSGRTERETLFYISL